MNNINLSFEQLEKIALETENAQKTNLGVLAVYTGERTSRSPKDRYIVISRKNKKIINWGEYNQPIKPDVALKIFAIVLDYLEKLPAPYIFEGFVGGGIYKMSVKVTTSKASQAMFANIMFDKKNKFIKNFKPDITVFSIPELKLNPAEFGINSEAAIIIDLDKKLVIVVGTGYTCEIKKAIFAIFNYCMPTKKVLTMHCAANCDLEGKNTALFFGLSGTGKTTLSTNENRALIGDDEHGIDKYGVFNIESGCYAKCIDLKKEKEPIIFNAIKKGAMIENVPVNNSIPDFSSREITENTRAAYPIEYIKNSRINRVGGLPSVIFFLSADAEGVLPPISRLTGEQIAYYFLSGYTSKLGGTEGKIEAPEATFSACFGEPFMPLKPKVYAKLLLKKIKENNIKVYLVNTGWYGGVYTVGSRIPLKCTRALVDGAINGELEKSEFVTESHFNLQIPKAFKEWTELLNPKSTWKNAEEYENAANKISAQIANNYKKYN